MSIQVDLRVVPDASNGAPLHYFTSSKTHNIAVRKLTLERSYKIKRNDLCREQKPLTANLDFGTEFPLYNNI